MVIRIADKSDFEKLVPLFKGFFPIHNQFQKPKSEIIKYLTERAAENTFLVYDEGGTIKAALFVVQNGKSADGKHTLWKYRHFAFQSQQVAAALLREAEKRVQKSSPTAKVELTIAENEPGIAFYKAQKYVQEGALENHYRWGETCFILSKSFN